MSCPNCSFGLVSFVAADRCAYGAATPNVRARATTAVAQALNERRQLKLVVHGAYDAQRDARALRDEEARQELTRALGVKLKPGEDPGPIAYDDPDTQRALEKLLSARAGADAVDRFSADYTKQSGRAVHRVNPVLAAFGRSADAPPQ